MDGANPAMNTHESQDSSLIERIAYEPSTETLHVRLRGGGREYTYTGVPAELYQEFINARSLGGFWNAYIKGKF
jgi:hypothetical protein